MFCILDQVRLDINDKHMKQQVMQVISNFEYLTFRTITLFWKCKRSSYCLYEDVPIWSFNFTCSYDSLTPFTTDLEPDLDLIVYFNVAT